MSSETAKQVGRRQARRQALFLLYRWEPHRAAPGDRSSRASPTPSGRSSPRAVSAEAPSLDARITGGVRGLDRRSSRYARAERPSDGIYGLEEGMVPAEVAINEAVLLGKRYATEDAARLVNGILGRHPAGDHMTEIDRIGRVAPARGGAVERLRVRVDALKANADGGGDLDEAVDGPRRDGRAREAGRSRGATRAPGRRCRRLTSSRGSSRRPRAS